MALIVEFLRENVVFVVSAVLVAGLVGVSTKLQQEASALAVSSPQATSTLEVSEPGFAVAVPANSSEEPIVSTQKTTESQEPTPDVVSTSVPAITAQTSTVPSVSSIRVEEEDDFDD